MSGDAELVQTNGKIQNADHNARYATTREVRLKLVLSNSYHENNGRVLCVK